MWQSVFVVTHDFVGAACIANWQGGAVGGYFIEFVGEAPFCTGAAYSLEPLAQGSSDSLGFRFAREFGQSVSQSHGFLTTNIQRHVSPPVDKLLHTSVLAPAEKRARHWRSRPLRQLFPLNSANVRNSTQPPRPPELLMMPPPAISSSRFSRMKSGISAGSKPKSLCTRSWESLYIARAAFRPGSRALHNWRVASSIFDRSPANCSQRRPRNPFIRSNSDTYFCVSGRLKAIT
jgi:hypothetical protein